MSCLNNELLKYIMRQEAELAINETKVNIENELNSLSTGILEEIITVLKNHELSDFDIVENIVCIMEKYDIDCGVCHDFG